LKGVGLRALGKQAFVCERKSERVRSAVQQVYWQWIKPIDACTDEDGRFVGHMLMDISAKNESGLATAVKDFVVKTAMLRDSFAHFGSLVIALLIPWSCDTDMTVETVVSKHPQAVTEAEAECMGHFLLSQLEGGGLRANKQLTPRIIPSPHRKRSRSPRPSKHASLSPHSSGSADRISHDETVTRAVGELVQQFPALRKLHEHEWFKPMMLTICLRLTGSHSLSRRLSVGSFTAARRGSMGSFSKLSQGKVTPAPAEPTLSITPICTMPGAAEPRAGGLGVSGRRATLSERRKTRLGLLVDPDSEVDGAVPMGSADRSGEPASEPAGQFSSVAP
jgi:hypothetical protein